MTLRKKWQFIKIFLILFEGTPIIFATIFTSIVFLIIWFFVNLVDIEKYRIQNTLEMQGVRVESSLIDSIDHTFAIIKNMNSQIAKDPNNKKYINQILEKFKTSPDLSDAFSWTIFSWANSHHQIIVDAEYGIMKKPFDLSNRDYIPLTVERPQEFHLGSLVLGSTSKKWMIPGGVGAVDKDGKYLGALTIGFEINALARSLNKALQNKNVGFELVDQNCKTILYGYGSSFGLSSGSLIDRSLIKSMLKKLRYDNKKVSISDISFFKNRHGIVVRKIENSSYYLILRYDDREIANELWVAFISRSVEILLLFLTASFLLAFIYRREQKQKQKILALKRLVENTNDIKNEFALYSAKEFKNFVLKTQDCAVKIKDNLEKQVINYAQEEQKLITKSLSLNNEIITLSHNLLEFIDNIIDLNQSEKVKIRTDEDDGESDTIKVVSNSIKLLQKIANSSGNSSDQDLINKIEDNLHQISKINPNRTKQVIIKLIPNIAKHGLGKTHIEVFINNDNDNIDK